MYVGWVKKAKDAGLTVRGGLQCVFGCRYEGRIDPDANARRVTVTQPGQYTDRSHHAAGEVDHR